ncbi:MAG: DUF4173 domain-containing protein, partial [Mesorhizobium sp.]
PALDRFYDRQGKTADAGAVGELARLRGIDEGWYRSLQENWRSWSFRDWRLLRYLDSRRPIVVPGVAEPVPDR